MLGSDLPTYQNILGSASASYAAYSLSLFSGSGPQYTDINQGQLGDCFFLSALATEALQDPSLIENMIQSNGNGTYSVDFHVNGQDDYVTVNSQLVTYASIRQWDGSSLAFDSNAQDMWAPLIEKAYAQLMEQTGVTTLSGVGNINSFSAMNGGDSNGLQAITGQAVTEDWIGSGDTASTAQSYLSQAQAAFNSGQGVMLGTDTLSVADHNMVGGHMFTVVGLSASADTVTLFNPWGTSISGMGMDSVFTVGLGELMKDGVYLEYTTGTRATV